MVVYCNGLLIFLFLLAAQRFHETYGFTSYPITTKKSCFQCSHLSVSSLEDHDESFLTSETTGKRANGAFREVMALIIARYGDECDCRRTKMYIYRAKELSITSVTGVLDFLEAFLPRESVQQLLIESPRILNKSVDSYLRPTADFLLNLWGEELFNQAMERNPQLLLTSGIGYNNKANPGSSKKKNLSVDNVLIETVDLSEAQLKKLRRQSPFVFSLAPNKIKEGIHYLCEILEPSGNPKRILRKMIMTNPNFLNLHVHTNLRPRVEYLTSTLQLSAKELPKLLKAGSVLALSVDQNLKPTLEYLKNDLLLDGNLKKCVLSHPALLALSLSNLQRKTNALNSISKGLASKVARRCPSVFSLSLDDNIYPTVEFLARVWGCQDDNTIIGAWLQEYPNVLTLSVEGNIQPTMNFFNRTGYTVLDDDWQLVKGNKRIPGRYIASSLFHRLLPRWHYCMKNDVPKPPLHIIVGSTDESFCQYLSLDIHQFALFQKEASPRLKFSSQFDTWLKTGRPIDI
ncbi:unnamed protein product [Cylindrotheca closterium]|uniref:Uncharacterized protein n=1 Tax=Cylindrotheca closterium TaxID=2856 RepID=A0AAD2FSE9_9STRA|nr:unnamed protein product [Cylindrotheca closterium]